MKVLFLVALVTFIFVAYVAADLPDGPRSLETMIPMRDGIELHTQIFFPRGYARDKSKKYPAIIDRSPYGYGDMEWITDIFLPFDFVAIGQDMRGTEKSQGNFTMWALDKYDSEDLGNWIVAQEWSDGRVMSFGASADGLASLQMPFNNPSFIAAQYIAWAPAKMYDILFPHGTYKQETAEEWLLGLTMPNPDFVYTNIELTHKNEAHTDFWKQIELDADVYKNVKYPSGFWGGWYDLFIVGLIEAFDGYNNLSDESVRHTSQITIDPLGHCIEAAEFFPQNAYEGRTGIVIGQLFEVYGIRPVTRDNIKNVTFYVMSSNDEAGLAVGQYWTSLDTFPTPRMIDYYIHSDKTATTSRPGIKSDEAESTSYIYDPANPVPTAGGNNLPPSIGGSIMCGPQDQAELDKRSDVITFQTETFSDALPLSGPLLATIYVSSDAIDTDFMVKISDVYPTGEARLIQDNAVRMRWREDTCCQPYAEKKPVFMEKDKVYEINMNLWNTSYIIAPGHALRFSISSSNNPRFSVNPNNGLLLADPAYPGVNITATNTIYHSFKYPSKVTLPVVFKHQLPEVHIIKAYQQAYPHLTDEVLAKATKALNSRMKK